MKTVAEVLESHDIVVSRSGKILCPNHDDTNPSCSVKEEYVYCFTCLWSADAAGLEAKLSDRPVTMVLSSWYEGKPMPRAERAKRPPELRHEIWLDWVEWSDQVLWMARYRFELEQDAGDLEPWQIDLAMRQTDLIFEAANDVCKPRAEGDELAPFAVRSVIIDCKAMLRRWWDRNLPAHAFPWADGA